MIWVRKIATPLTIFSSMVVAGSGLWMFFAFKFHYLQELHEKTGLLFAAAVALHLVINWRSFKNHVQHKVTYWSLLPVLILAGALLAIELMPQPRRALSANIIFNALASKSIHTVSSVFDSNDDAVIAAMRADQLHPVDANQTLTDLAEKDDVEIRQLFSYFVKPNRP